MTRRSAFSLIEVLVAITILGIVMSLSIAAIFGTLKSFEADGQLDQRLRNQAELADRFRADVAAAREAPAEAGDMKAGPDCLLLRSAGERLVVYRWADGRLTRDEIEGDMQRPFICPLAPESPKSPSRSRASASR